MKADRCEHCELMEAEVAAAKEECRKWRVSFIGHVYVPSSEYAALVNRAEKAEEQLELAERERDGLVECVKLSTEYRQGNPAFEQAVARAAATTPDAL